MSGMTRAMGVLILGAIVVFSAEARRPLDALAQLGKEVFFDRISEPNGAQGCASCHVPVTGWTHPESNTITAEGAVAGRFGNRKPPTNAYIVFSPVRDDATRTGGAFWDARATGTALQLIAGLDDVPANLFGPAADQSVLPFGNPLEHNTTPLGVCEHVRDARYSGLYDEAWGKPIDCSDAGLDESFARIGLAIVAYEGTEDVSPFRSRFDLGALSRAETLGFEIFKRVGCSNCHDVDDDVLPGDGSRPLFTDFRTRNIGVPRNPDNPFYSISPEFNPAGETFVDVGVDGGRFKTPTLRNVGRRPYPKFVKRFMHNSWFTSLEGVVHFYNTRDVLARCLTNDVTMEEALAMNCWPAPENAENISGDGVDPNDPGLGDLGLTAEEERQVVAFLFSLSDLTVVVQPAHGKPR